MGAFALQMAAFIAKTKADSDLVVRAVLMKIDGRLINRSPVGDATYWKSKPPKGYVGGRFRGSWQMSIGSPAGGISRAIDADGAATLAAHASIAAIAKAGDIIFMINNTAYGKRIEQGWSRQAPVGVVGLTVVEFNTMFDEAVNGVRAGTSASDFAQGWSNFK